jgi:hypothetical protein
MRHERESREFDGQRPRGSLGAACLVAVRESFLEDVDDSIFAVSDFKK